MSGFPPIETRAAGPRRGLTLLLLLLAFAAGVGAAAWAGRRLGWFASPAPVVATAPAPRPAPVAALPPAPDALTLATREETLAGELAGLEARTAAVRADADQAGRQAARAEALLLAFAARRAVERGGGLGWLEGELRARFGASEAPAVAAVVDAARRPVTLDDLRLQLDALAPELASGSLAGGWWRSVRRELAQLVVLRRAGQPSPLAADRLQRARRLLDAGRVEAAYAEVAQLPGAASAGGWADAARRYVRATRALDRLEGAALAGRITPA
jgi:hypothetical protein